MNTPKLSIIIPALNECACIIDTLLKLQRSRQRGHEVILIDGGSDDATPSAAEPFVDRIYYTCASRARQMNLGASHSTGEMLLFLHADTRVPDDIDRLISGAIGGRSGWGRFDISLSGANPLLRIIEAGMNLRSRLTGIATGDQGLFVSRDWFDSVEGFPDQPLMEDIALSRSLKRLAPPVCLEQRLITSSRRWERYGVVRTMVKMWYLRAAYYFGVPAERLVKQYD
ncbi:TIGR04283 family arsenosugar biosynthesis glycosyltransferase [Pseudomonadota bacterium]